MGLGDDAVRERERVCCTICRKYLHYIFLDYVYINRYGPQSIYIRMSMCVSTRIDQMVYARVASHVHLCMWMADFLRLTDELTQTNRPSLHFLSFPFPPLHSTTTQHTHIHNDKKAVIRPFAHKNNNNNNTHPDAAAAATNQQPAAAAESEESEPLLQVQTIDFFKAFTPRFDPFLFGQIAGAFFLRFFALHGARTYLYLYVCVCDWMLPLFHVEVYYTHAHIHMHTHTNQTKANHALSDCHAMNARPTTALALAVVPFAAEDKVCTSLLFYACCMHICMYGGAFVRLLWLHGCMGIYHAHVLGPNHHHHTHIYTPNQTNPSTRHSTPSTPTHTHP
jgi:hypothetical protein